MIDLPTLARLVSYCPDTGDMTWSTRQKSDYANDGLWKRFNRIRAGKPACHLDSVSGYMITAVRLGGEEMYIRAHRLAWALTTGHWPTESIDHINGNRSDNRLSNLRQATSAENSRNMKLSCKNSSGVSGVNFCNTRGKWVAKIMNGETRRHLGYFASKEEACYARKRAEIVLGYHANHGGIDGRWVRKPKG